MKKIIKENLKKIVPSSILIKYRMLKSKKGFNKKNHSDYEEKVLDKLNHSDYDLSNLISLTENNLKEIFNEEKNNVQWNKNINLIKDINLPEMTGGINKGDQRAIFYLINHFKPKNVLEIGTHIGCSTVSICLAFKVYEDENKNLTTVDIINVNDISEKAWLNYNSANSPIEMVSKIGSIRV